MIFLKEDWEEDEIWWHLLRQSKKKFHCTSPSCGESFGVNDIDGGESVALHRISWYQAEFTTICPDCGEPMVLTENLYCPMAFPRVRNNEPIKCAGPLCAWFLKCARENVPELDLIEEKTAPPQVSSGKEDKHAT